jgi:hypothetical protein
MDPIDLSHSKDGEMDQLSHRGEVNITQIMARIPKAMLDGTKNVKCTNSIDDTIDLSMAENWLLRPEVLQLCKEAVQNHFEIHVRATIAPSYDPTLTFIASFLANRFLGRFRPSETSCPIFQYLLQSNNPS